MSDAVHDALRAAGIAARCEVRERLLIVIPTEGADLAPRRRELLALAARLGFSHVALELA